MKLRRRCKCGCGGITRTDKKWIKWHHNRGESHPSYKHGLTNHKLFMTWQNMKKRCYNPNCKSFPNYGGRGIRVCIKWRDNFKAFYNWAITNGWEPRLQIDRINNNQGYRPSNCRFVTNQINQNNKRGYKKPKNNTTGHKGITFNKHANKYRAQPWNNGKQVYLGYFNTAKEAAQAIEEYKNG